MKEYRVIIAGSREFSDYEKLKENCDRILQEKLEDEDSHVIIVSGHARGADTLGEQYAMERCLKQYGRAAGMIRNREMANVANALIACPQVGVENKGTQNMVMLARKKQLDVFVVE